MRFVGLGVNETIQKYWGLMWLGKSLILAGKSKKSAKMAYFGPQIKVTNWPRILEKNVKIVIFSKFQNSPKTVLAIQI